MRPPSLVRPFSCLGLGIALAVVLSGTFLLAGPRPPAEPRQAGPPNDLDALMDKVLAHRADTWRQLQDYILDEQERFEIRGPGDVRLFGQRRDYSWYVRDGYLVRSPVKYNGVTLSEADRKKYEADWLNEEHARERREDERRARKDQRDPSGAPVKAGIDDILRDGVEPRFISEAYFLRFKFEPGNYYLVGREQIAHRDLLRIEYYPRKRMFDDRDDEKNQENQKNEQNRKHDKRDDKIEEEFERKFNKVSLVTLWVDPEARQIVKYTFDLPDFGFLPGRWLVRVDDAKASMVMSQPLAQTNVWLPQAIDVEGGFTLANGGYRFLYGREFLNYKQGETRAKIRGYEPREQ